MDFQRLLALATYLGVVELNQASDEEGLRELIRRQQLRD